MKLRLLNASHQAMCYLGYLSGYRYAHEVCSDPLFTDFLLGYMDREATPTLEPVPGRRPRRLQAPADRAVRQPRDQGHPGAAVRGELRPDPEVAGAGDPAPARRTAARSRRSALVVAAWARYAEGVDEAGRADRRRRPPTRPGDGARPAAGRRSRSRSSRTATCSTTSPTSRASPRSTSRPSTRCTRTAPARPSRRGSSGDATQMRWACVPAGRTAGRARHRAGARTRARARCCSRCGPRRSAAATSGPSTASTSGTGPRPTSGVVAGHEPCGEVVAVGHGVPPSAVGDRVVVYHIVGCGVCDECRMRLPDRLHRPLARGLRLAARRRARGVPARRGAQLPAAARLACPSSTAPWSRAASGRPGRRCCGSRSPARTACS